MRGTPKCRAAVLLNSTLLRQLHSIYRVEQAHSLSPRDPVYEIRVFELLWSRGGAFWLLPLRAYLAVSRRDGRTRRRGTA